METSATTAFVWAPYVLVHFALAPSPAVTRWHVALAWWSTRFFFSPQSGSVARSRHLPLPSPASNRRAAAAAAARTKREHRGVREKNTNRGPIVPVSAPPLWVSHPENEKKNVNGVL